MAEHAAWPELPLSAWRESCETLHRWTQVVGKIQLALTPLVNHWWNVTLFVTARGLTTPPLAYAEGTFSIAFDFVDHRLYIISSGGARDELALAPMSVARFYAQVMGCLERLNIKVQIWTMPSEIPGAVPFEQDDVNAHYDPVWVRRFWQGLSQADRVLKEFRTGFIGKVSPVHFFWGSFDLAVTRFSGRRAPPPTGTTPNVAAWVMAEAYSHEVMSCGFWPGNGGYGRPAFYAYAYPEPAAYGATALKSTGAFYDQGLGQFILPYDAVREAPDPDRLLLGFLEETYAAAADLAGWDRAALERDRPSEPRLGPART
ncbi:MAG: DUF5996 family protein [Hyphomicrobiaceae bacterium]